MNNTEIRVVTGPANYFSHSGSLGRVTDFSRRNSFPTPFGCTANARLPLPGLTCRKRLNALAQNICGLPVIVAKGMLPSWRTPAATIVRW